MSNDLNSLRQKALEQEIIQEPVASRSAGDRIFGMTAAERMFVSIGCFLTTTLVGFLLLLILDKIALP